MKVRKKEGATDKRMKLCFAQPGQVVRLIGVSGEPEGPHYLVYRLNEQVQFRPSPPFSSNGLYSSPYPHGVINLETGICADMPHLSQRMVVVHNAEFVLSTVPTLEPGDRATVWHEGTKMFYEANILGPGMPVVPST